MTLKTVLSSILKEQLYDRQENIFKMAFYYQPDQSIITKVKYCSFLKDDS